MPNQIKAGAILTYVTLFLNSAIGLLYTPFLTLKLGQAEYGLYSLVASVVGSLTILDFGFGNALIRYTANLRAKKQEQKLKEMYKRLNLFINQITNTLTTKKCQRLKTILMLILLSKLL